METLILGAGVVGLSTAITLERANIPTRVLAADLPPRTTSNVAAAFWEPFKADPVDLVRACSIPSFAEFTTIANQHPQAGVALRPGTALFRHRAPDPWWRDLVPGFHHVPPPEGYADAHAYHTYIIDTPRYMPWLLDLYRSLGGRIEQRTLTHLDQALATHDVVVNCTGLGSRTLLPDPTLYPARGQLLRLPQFGLDHFFLDDTEDALTYIIPRTTDVIVGGTFQPHHDDLTPDPATAQQILHRATQLVPQLAHQPILEHLVGLRPCRPALRLELQPHPPHKHVIHNYGHGGCGITLSWGCAQHVLRIIQSLPAAP